MASIFNALNIGYSGLNAAQIGIDTTGHNISNAETEGYTRQRVVTSEAQPIGITPGQRGNGTQITEITRIFDSFVYGRYTSAAQNKEYSDTMKKNLEELSTYFPDIDNVGIKEDLKGYFDLWQSLASNPDNTAIKVALAQQTQTLSQHISQTRDQIGTLQNSLDEQIAVSIDEVNRLGIQIADLNKSIGIAESDGVSNANDLRDQRGVLEMSLTKLIGASVYTDRIDSNMSVDSHVAIENGNYTIHVGGFNIVDGSSFHSIGVDNTKNSGQFNDIYYERQDGVRFSFADRISGGKVGALIELRGSSINENGTFDDGLLQDAIKSIDIFAKGLIESINNVYAQSATDSMQSNKLSFDDQQSLLSTDENFKAGTFNLVVYDLDGNQVSSRTITIDESTFISGSAGGIVEQINADKDDNKDNNALNDINDILSASFEPFDNIFSIKLNDSYKNAGYKFAIEDKGTNFAGVTGLNRFFDGSDASDIELSASLKEDPAKIRSSKSPTPGDNQMALDIVQLQFSNVDFKESYKKTTTDTIYGFYDDIVTRIGTRTNSAISSSMSISAQFNAIGQEYASISKVSIDEEMANLIRYQTSYGAAAKVITTIDQMMTTLLGLKQ